MGKVSAGILLHRHVGEGTEVLLVHPGGPLWSGRDEGAWSVPKGLAGADEDEFACAVREFHEETGFFVDERTTKRDLGSFRLPSGKRLHVWAIEGDCDPAALRSNSFEMQWPPRSGRMAQFPEVDGAAWFKQPQALLKISGGQKQVLEAFYTSTRPNPALDLKPSAP
jgi:predicted NUDIX family NTP pyrophosphohydrolase